MSARLTFAKVLDGHENYVGKACTRGDHDGCPGGFGVRIGFLCGVAGAGPIVSTEEGAPCACSCHDASDAP